MKRLSFLCCLLLAWLLAACQSQPVTGENVPIANGSYKDITARELNEMLKNKDFIFINVHIPFAGEIAGTDQSFPYNEIEQNMSGLPADKNTKIVLYCRSGRMSQLAAEELVLLGYTNVWNLEGGMAEWEEAGYQIQE